MDPAKIVSEFNLKNGDYVADFGSGHGYFVVPLAQAIAPDGKVFAIDIQRQVLDVTRAKSRLANIQNVEYIWADLERPQGSKLKDDFVDIVLVTNILHQATHKEQIIKEAYRVLHSSGHLVLIEWKTGEKMGTFGPPNQLRIDTQTAIDLCVNQSFALEREFDAGSDHYGILFAKK